MGSVSFRKHFALPLIDLTKFVLSTVKGFFIAVGPTFREKMSGTNGEHVKHKTYKEKKSLFTYNICGFEPYLKRF